MRRGRYRFENLAPGSTTSSKSSPSATSSVQQEQPAGYFDGSQRAGSHGGDTSVPNRISRIAVPAGEVTVDGLRFLRASASGSTVRVRLRQDGAPLYSLTGKPPEDARQLRTGELKPGDKRIAGVTLELLDVATGQPIHGDSPSVLPGRYAPARSRR
jgi:hypothetical protein